MKHRGVAEQQVTRAGDEQAGRPALHIGEYWRYDRILRISRANVFIWSRLVRIEWFQPSWQAFERENLARVAGTREVGGRGKHSQRTGKRQAELFQLRSHFAGQNRACRRSGNSDLFWLVRFQQLFVDGDDIVDRCREWIFGREPVVDGNDFYFGKI